MIPKGLKVGDIFEDGGSYYKVLEVHENGNYYSTRVEKPADPPKPKPAPKKTTTTTRKKKTEE